VLKEAVTNLSSISSVSLCSKSYSDPYRITLAYVRIRQHTHESYSDPYRITLALCYIRLYDSNTIVVVSGGIYSSSMYQAAYKGL
jgi:uncharacterized circularly permuted ATP-grasp superfamily protein